MYKNKKRAVLIVLTSIALIITLIVSYVPDRHSNDADKQIAEKEKTGDKSGPLMDGTSKTDITQVQISEAAQMVNDLTARWASEKVEARMALDMKKLYSLWTLRGGAAQKRKVNALTYLNRETVAESCLALYRSIHYVELAEMLKDKNLTIILKSAFDNSYKMKEGSLTRWNNRAAFDVDGFVPAEVINEIQLNYNDPLKQKEWSDQSLTLASTFPDSFVAWYKEAIRASLYAYLADDYIRNNAPSDLKEAQKRLAILQTELAKHKMVK